MKAIRGAITVKCDSAEEIDIQSARLIKEILSQNIVNISDIVTIIFTVTDDITARNPATAVRETLNLDNVALLCVKEAKFSNTLPLCIRVLVIAEKISVKDPIFCYLDGAKNLRQN
ncbi:MAG: chorismate mutase [Clostridia bacterium]